MAGKKERNRVKVGAVAGKARRGWRARAKKIVVRGGVLIVLLLVVGVLVVTQTGVVGGLAIGAISRATGLACGAGSVRVTGSGLEI